MTEPDRTEISASQLWQPKCIIGTMKPLILILLAAICAEAQTLADIARQERARQARIQSARIITTEGIRTTAPVLAAQPAPVAVPAAPNTTAPTAPTEPNAPTAPTASAPSAPAAPATPAATAPAAAAPAVDPVQKWNDDMQKARARLRELQTEETSLQLQLNDLTNQFTAPVSDENTRRQVQTSLGEVQNRLNAVRSELDQARRSVQAMEAQGPPAPRR